MYNNIKRVFNIKTFSTISTIFFFNAFILVKNVKADEDITNVKSVMGFVDFFVNNKYEHLIQIGISIIVFLLFLILRKIFTKYIFKLIIKITSKTKTDLDRKFFMGFEKPLRTLFIVLGLYASLRVLGTDFHISIEFINHCLSSSIIILISWGLYNLTGEYSLLFDEMKDRLGLKVDMILFPFVSKTIRLIILALALTLVLSEWGKNIQMFITGLGLGGLAFSLAAKDAASNIIAGFVIIMEKPFNIGDWVSTSEIEGVVEDISFRSTRIRTFGQELITVPNSNLANVPITNYSRRGKRRVTFNLGVTYTTSKQKLQICVERIQSMLQGHIDVHKETIMVNFDRFNNSSLDIFIYFFTKTINWEDYLKVKEDVNYKIMTILEEEGVQVAFPSTSIYFENSIKHERDRDLLDDNEDYGSVI